MHKREINKQSSLFFFLNHIIHYKMEKKLTKDERILEK
jgi:hypothetical protein